jgi:hypothetical protein
MVNKFHLAMARVPKGSKNESSKVPKGQKKESIPGLAPGVDPEEIVGRWGPNPEPPPWTKEGKKRKKKK